jgi:hypothetical protein
MFSGNVVQNHTDQLFVVPITDLFFQSTQPGVLLSTFKLLVAMHKFEKSLELQAFICQFFILGLLLDA